MVLAPMAGFTDLAQRLLCLEQGADAVWSEMVNARSLLEKNPRGLALLATEARDRPLVVQVFGGDPALVAEAVAWVHATLRPAAIDLNFGCPVKKVARAGAGATLMREPERIAAIVAAVRRAFDGVLCIKIRKGWGGESVTAPWVVERARDWGVDLVMLHPRLATQMYGGQPDWELAARCRGLSDLPLIASGNVVDEASARWILDRTGFDGLAIGRAAIGDPAIFARLRRALDGGGVPAMAGQRKRPDGTSPAVESSPVVEPTPVVDPAPVVDPSPIAGPKPGDRIAMARRHFELVLELTGGDEKAFLWQRKTLVRYFRGFRGAAEARKALMTVEGNGAVLRYLEGLAATVEALPADRGEGDPSAGLDVPV